MIPRSTASPSIWWNTGECRGVERLVAVRAARHHEKIGGGCVSMTRICTGDVWVRNSTCSGSAELDVQRVLHRARRVAGREVQRLEVVPVVLDLGTLGDLVAEADEHVLELALALGDEVEVAAAGARARPA